MNLQFLHSSADLISDGAYIILYACSGIDMYGKSMLYFIGIKEKFMDNPKKTAFVTGSSSGIGKCLCDILLREGYIVYGMSRRGSGGGVIDIIGDVSSYEAVKAAAERIVKEHSQIDLLVSNAGYGISGSAEYTQPEDAYMQFDVNFFGFYHCIKAVLPYMRAQGSGRIIAVSSAAAEFSIPFQSFYSASKAALSSFCSALDSEVREFGIRTVSVMPGDVKTPFTQARKKNSDEDTVYSENEKTSVGLMEKDEVNGMSSEYAAGQIYRAIKKRNPAPAYTAGFKYKLFMAAGKVLPARTISWLIRKIYLK